MAGDALLAWREPLAADWRGQIAALAARIADDAEPLPLADAGRLRRLASMRVGAGERLQLRRLARRASQRPEPPGGFRAARLLLASNRTTSFFAGDLEAAGLARGLLIETVELDYDGVRALALKPDARIAGRFDGVLLLLDEGFFGADGALLDAAAEARDVAASVAELDAVVGGLRETAQAPVIAATLALPPELQAASADRAMAGARVRQVLAVNAALAEAAAAGRVLLFDLAALAARIGTDVFFDPVRFLQAKAPFSFEASPVVADGVAALVAAMCGRSGRVLALDLDNTLWGGGIADDGLDGIALGQGSPEGEAFVAVQRHALGLRRRGVVLAVCSKNSEAIAREPFRSHPDMLLREEHISAFVANFDDKASNLARIAATLDLDPSALVLLDDNPAERERVRSALPWVVVPELGDDPALFVRALISSGAFEHLPLTFEDTVRVGAYEARAEAEALRDSLGDYDAYLASLDMALSIAPFDAIGRARIVQLIQKSNQFNMTTRRYTEPEIEALQADLDCLTWQVRLRDRFADHGMVSAMVVRKAPGAWTIDSWVMSCRVLERGVEAALIGELARTAAACGVGELRGLYRPTARNGLVRDLYAKLGFEAGAADADGAVTWRLDPTIACFAAAPMRIAIAAAPAVASAG